MCQPTGLQRDAASTIFNLPNYRVINAVDLPDDGGRRVTVESVDDFACLAYGVIVSKVHSRRLQRIRDVPVAGAVEVVWAKRRWFCTEELCDRVTFAEATAQVPRFARSTTRLKEEVVAAVISSGRAVREVADAHQVSWWLVQTALSRAAVVGAVLADVHDEWQVDEKRYLSESSMDKLYKPDNTETVAIEGDR